MNVVFLIQCYGIFVCMCVCVCVYVTLFVFENNCISKNNNFISISKYVFHLQKKKMK